MPYNPDSKLAPPRVVCAAIRFEGRPLILGARHFDKCMCDTLDALGEDGTLENHEQGFIDQFGNFLTREEAWAIAKENGQVFRDHDVCAGTLFSEHLY